MCKVNFFSFPDDAREAYLGRRHGTAVNVMVVMSAAATDPTVISDASSHCTTSD